MCQPSYLSAQGSSLLLGSLSLVSVGRVPLGQSPGVTPGPCLPCPRAPPAQTLVEPRDGWALLLQNHCSPRALALSAACQPGGGQLPAPRPLPGTHTALSQTSGLGGLAPAAQEGPACWTKAQREREHRPWDSSQHLCPLVAQPSWGSPSLRSKVSPLWGLVGVRMCLPWGGRLEVSEFPGALSW